MAATEVLTAEEAPPSRGAKILKWTGWGVFALFCLIFFTFLKLPEARLKTLLEGTLANTLRPYGITYTARKTELSVGIGISYNLQGVNVNFPGRPGPLQVDRIEISPSLFPLLLGKLSSGLSVEMGKGSLETQFTVPLRMSQQQQPPIDLTFDIESLDLAKLGFLSQFGGLKGVLVISGQGSISGDLSNPQSVDGDIELESEKISLPSQTVMGFAIPEIAISQAEADLSIDGGKVKIQDLDVGKKGSQDDLIAEIRGAIDLNRRLDYSRADLTAKFQLSDKIKKALPLIDTILQAGKRKDGAYAFQLKGPLNALYPTPLKE